MTEEHQPEKTTARKAARQNHVVAHIDEAMGTKANPVFDEIVVFGTKLEALEYVYGKADWVYQAIPNGVPFGGQA